MYEDTIAFIGGVLDEMVDETVELAHRVAAIQPDLFGQEHPPQGMDLNDKVDWVLTRYPETQGNDTLLVVRCWMLFDRLEEAIGEGAASRLVAWAEKGRATSAETYRRRRQETQRLRSKNGSLRPANDVVARRRRRDGAGPPGRSR